MHLNASEQIWFKLGTVTETSEPILKLGDLVLDSRSQGCEKAETSAPVTSQSSEWIGMELAYC